MRTNNASLTHIFTAVVFTGLLTVTSFKVVKAQGSASKGDPVKELVENMRSANFTDVNTEPSLVWKYGETTDAQDYSNNHDVIAFICSIGADAPFKDEQIVKAMDENVFTGDIEAPIAIFISPEKVVGKEGAVFVAYIRGESFRDDYTGEKYLSPQEVIDSAPQMKNKLKDISRKIDTNPEYNLPEK